MRFNSRIFFFFLLLNCQSAFNQNLYDIPHSKEFATYLFKSQQYSLAAIEYERLLFLEPANDTLRESLIRCYSLNQEYSIAINRLNVFYPEIQTINSPFNDLFAYNLISDHKNETARNFIQTNQHISTERKHFYQAFSYLLDEDYKKSEQILSEIPATESSIIPLRSFSQEGIHLKRKSPGLAMAMSAIVPGSGKFYTGDWKDGIISVLTIAAASFTAYRGFHVHGTDKAYGWIYGTMATGFYFGNIYGSYTSAKRYNKRQSDKLAQKVRAAFALQP